MAAPPPRRGHPGQHAPDVPRADAGEEPRGASHVRTGEIAGSSEGAGRRGPDADTDADADADADTGGELVTPRQPSPQLGPVGGTPEIADPNFPVSHPEVGQAGKAGQASASLDELNSRGPVLHRPPRQGKDLMSPAVEVCTPTTQLYYVALMMADRDVGAIPVVEDTDTMRPAGIITDRDIVVRVIAKRQDVSAMRAGDCMSTGVVTVTPDDDLDTAVRKMEREQVRRLIVVDAAGRVVGIVAQADVALHDTKQAAELAREVSKPDGGAEERRYH